jgi:hypothetical protein
MQTPILGQAYVARSVNAADNRMVNLYPEAIPNEGQTAGWLQRAPGLRLLATIGSGPIRGLWDFQPDSTTAFVVSGNELYKINANYTTTLLGTVAGTGPVSMADNGTQLFIAANPQGYIYNNTTNVFSQITDPDFPGAVTVAYLDGYFVFNEPNSQKVWVTSLLDGLSVDPLDFASAEGTPDLLTSLVVNNREVWLLGTNSIEIWYDAGTPDFPLARIQGASNEIGCAAPYSVAKADNSVFWLGSDTRGRGVVYRSNGYTGVRASNHSIEWQIQSYGNISDAVAYTYQQDGHTFYVINFPSADKTWVYDITTQSWHERAGWLNGAYVRHRSSCQMSFNNEIIVGDYENGNIYAFDLNVNSDNGAVQKWLRSWRALPSGTNNLKRTAQHSLQLNCETGVGLELSPGYESEEITTESGVSLTTENGVLLVTQSYLATPGYDPQAMLRWSDDGGHTWSNEHWTKMGKIGAFGYRAFWRRLGMTLKLRDRVYEVSGTDPVKIAIMGAELIVDGTNA